jgi:hypothetical protein
MYNSANPTVILSNQKITIQTCIQKKSVDRESSSADTIFNDTPAAVALDSAIEKAQPDTKREPEYGCKDA